MLWLKSIVVALVALVSSVRCFPEGRIINGTTSDITKYPFMVSLRGPTGIHICGSTIIAPRWIMTAAHCVVTYNANQLSIQYATTMIGANGTNVGTVKRVIRHKKFSPLKSLANDIALLELHGQLIYNYKTIGPVTLPEPNFEVPQTSAGASGILLGWGFNTTIGVVQSNLQEADLKIYSDEECNDRYHGATTTNHICGGVDEGGKGQCTYDSGGPLLYQNSVQLGIVSWSMKPCTTPFYPGVYTKVSHYIGWIHEQMNN